MFFIIYRGQENHGAVIGSTRHGCKRKKQDFDYSIYMTTNAEDSSSFVMSFYF